MDPTLTRRLTGTTAAILIVALAFLGMKARYAPPSGSYEVTAVLGRAGVGLTPGSDIKVRGVKVGSVASIDYTEGRAVATLRFDPEPQLPAADQLEMVVTAKTLLGEKQVELSFPDEAFDDGPRLQAGDRLVADREPTELSEVLDELEPFIAAMDGQEIATIVEALGEQQGEAETIVENLELGQQLAAFGARTADQNLANLRRLADISDAMAPAADDIGRLNRALPEATRVLREEQSRIARNLDALRSFSAGFADFLEIEEPNISKLIRSGDVIGAMLERQQNHIGGLVHGLYLYTSGFPHGIDLNDGTEAAGFKIFINLEEEHGEGGGEEPTPADAGEVHFGSAQDRQEARNDAPAGEEAP